VLFTAGASIPVMDLVRTQVERRTGVTEQSMGVDADALNNTTATAFQLGLNQASQRIEMVARTYAETGVRQVFEKFRSLITKHQDRASTIKLRGEYVEVDPSDWKDHRDTTVGVGLGTGGSTESLRNLSGILQEQKEVAREGSPMVGAEEVYATYDKMVEAAGYKDTAKYFAPPDSDAYKGRQEQKQQAQAAQKQEAEQAAQMQVEALKAQLEVQVADIQSRAQTAQREGDRKMAVEMAKLRADAEEQRQDFMTQLDDARREWTELKAKYQVELYPPRGADVVPFGGGD